MGLNLERVFITSRWKWWGKEYRKQRVQQQAKLRAGSRRDMLKFQPSHQCSMHVWRSCKLTARTSPFIGWKAYKISSEACYEEKLANPVFTKTPTISDFSPKRQFVNHGRQDCLQTLSMSFKHNSLFSRCLHNLPPRAMLALPAVPTMHDNSPQRHWVLLPLSPSTAL